VLPLPITFQPVQPITGRDLKIIQAGCQIYIFELSNGSTYHIWRHPFCLPGHVKLVRPLVSKRLYHKLKCNVSRDACQAQPGL
jgi:hypothetical protein